jgi:hypothetical protein
VEKRKSIIGSLMMNYYLLSEQDLQELIWDFENFILVIRDKIETKKIEEPNTENNE